MTVGTHPPTANTIEHTHITPAEVGPYNDTENMWFDLLTLCPGVPVESVVNVLTHDWEEGLSFRLHDRASLDRINVMNTGLCAPR